MSRILLGCLLAIGNASLGVAQRASPSGVTAGDRVRVTLSTDVGETRIDGRIRELRGDTILLRATGTREITAISRPIVARLEIPSESRALRVVGGVVKGTLWGAAIGAALGAGLPQGESGVTRDRAMRVGATVSGMIGFFTGAIVCAVHCVSWREVPLSTITP